MVTIPVESISDRIGCFGWLKRKCRQLQCMVAHHDVEVGSKVMVMDLGQEKKGDARVKEGLKVTKTPQLSCTCESWLTVLLRTKTGGLTCMHGSSLAHTSSASLLNVIFSLNSAALTI
ncbi:hypothetical protein ACFX2I_039253 [Malus domestica]